MALALGKILFLQHLNLSCKNLKATFANDTKTESFAMPTHYQKLKKKTCAQEIKLALFKAIKRKSKLSSKRCHPKRMRMSSIETQFEFSTKRALDLVIDRNGCPSTVRKKCL